MRRNRCRPCTTLLTLFISSFLILTGCSEPAPIVYEFDDIEELTIDEDFLFRTIDTVQVSIDISDLSLFSIEGLSTDYAKPVFTMTAVASSDEATLELIGSDDPQMLEELQDAGKIAELGSFVLGEDKTFTMQVSVPTSFDLLLIDFKAAGLPSYVEVPIDGNTAEYHHSATRSISVSSGSRSLDFSEEDKVSIYSKNGYQYLSEFDKDGKPENLANTKISVDADLLDKVNASLPSKSWVHLTNPEFLQNTDLVLDDSADVWVTMVSDGTSAVNSLGFIASTDPDIKDPGYYSKNIEDLIYIFPNASMEDSGGGLQPGDTMYLGNFEEGTTIYWALTRYGWNRWKNRNTNNTVSFSHEEWNPEYDRYPELSQHTAIIQYEGDDGYTHFIIGFEDTNRTYWCDHDFNDVIFLVTVNPVSAVVGTGDGDAYTIPRAISIIDDTDLDGISDSLDAFPDHAGLAAEQQYSGTVAFEDKWPYKHDYDFNDLVASYEYTLRTDSDNHIRSLQYRITIEALGAGYKNGLSLKLTADESDVLKDSVPADILVTGDYPNAYDTGIGISATPGIEAYGSPSGIVLKLIPEANSFVGNNGTILNTKPSMGEERTFDPASIEGTLYFSEGSDLTQTDLGEIPFDLFLIVDTQNRVHEVSPEVHLPDVPPSGLVEMAFPVSDDTVHDDSNPAAGKYYRSVENLPWAIHIPSTSWHYPLEGSDILTAYLDFDAWVMTGGESSTDWYIETVENTDTGQIYHYQVL